MKACGEEGSWLRLVVEKPFGMDLESSEELADQLGALFPEEQLYRIDHYLGKELMQNMLVLRHAPPVTGPYSPSDHSSKIVEWIYNTSRHGPLLLGMS